MGLPLQPSMKGYEALQDLVPKFTGNQQLSNHVCHEIGISYSFDSNQVFSHIFPLKTANFR